VAVGIYTTNNVEACKYISEHSEAEVIVVENAKQLEKFTQISHELPNLKVCGGVWDEGD
jgi:long-chain-fatty-acid--CoA ligase ACSBG